MKEIKQKKLTTESGIEIDYLEAGEGDPVVFLHGWIGEGHQYIKQLEKLSDRHKVIAPSFRGHGNSSKTLYGHTCKTYAQDIKEFIIKLDLGEVLLAGWSLGASVIFEYLNSFSAVGLKGICIIDQSPYPLNTRYWNLGAMKGNLDLELLLNITEGINENFDKTAQKLILSLFPDGESEDAIKRYLEYARKVPPVIASSIFLDLIAKDRRPNIHKIKAPSVFIFSHVSRFGRETAEWLKSKVTGSRLIYLKNCKHMPFYDNPDEFNNVLHSFAKDIFSK
jgi:pimeloyl-ACP methyl ester carboxylesterase